jgi:hypothetical protein
LLPPEPCTQPFFACSYFSGRVSHILFRASLRSQSSYLWPSM